MQRQRPSQWDVQPTQLAVSNPTPGYLSIVNPESYFGQRALDPANPLLFKGDLTPFTRKNKIT